MAEIDLAAERLRMVERDLRARGIDDPRLLEAFAAVPREDFVPADERQFAYSDRALPLGSGQTVSQPFVVAVMLDALHLVPTTHLLEVGAGSGYAAAVASYLVDDVVALERIGPLAEDAVRRLAKLDIANVSIKHTDGRDGWPKRAPYDAILVSAAADGVPQPLIDQLTDGGRLVAPIGRREWGQELLVGIKHGDRLKTKSVLDVAFVPLLRGREG
jgi:protein-L-isoaspartate(D-aspartate) O-methyltransferase